MAWNEPGNNGKDRDPWGNNGKNQGPPDLDEMLRKVSRRFGGLFGGGKSGGDVGKFGLSIALVVAVGVATLAVGLALTVRIREAYGSIEEDEVLASDEAMEIAETREEDR